MDGTTERKTVFFILNRDPSQVQGDTEKHYAAHYLAERTNLHVFAPMEAPTEGATNHRLLCGGLLGVFLLNIVLLPYWLYFFLRMDPDIIYCYEGVILPAFLGKVFGATVAFDLRSDPFDQAWEFADEDGRSMVFKISLWISKHLHTAALRTADHIFVLSETLGEAVAGNYGIDSDVLRLLPLGVDTDRFVPSDATYERYSIVYVGTLNERRGIDMVLRAVEGLPEDLQSELRVDLYGDGPEEYVNRLLQEYDESGEFNVHWHGLVPHEQLPEQAAKSDVAVSPLLPYDAFVVSSPAKVFEYLAMGLPVVASRIEPHERILDDGETALLYEPSSAEQLSEQLARLIKDDEARCCLQGDARKKAEEYSWDRRFTVLDATFEL